MLSTKNSLVVLTLLASISACEVKNKKKADIEVTETTVHNESNDQSTKIGNVGVQTSAQDQKTETEGRPVAVLEGPESNQLATVEPAKPNANQAAQPTSDEVARKAAEEEARKAAEEEARKAAEEEARKAAEEEARKAAEEEARKAAEEAARRAAEETGTNSEDKIKVFFSPLPTNESHAAKFAVWANEASETIDIAMYGISLFDAVSALKEAAKRNIKVRLILETASADSKLKSSEERAKSQSQSLSAAGIEVRFVNKIMHHKFAIVDGKKLMTGSANLSGGGTIRNNENIVFIQDNGELNSRFQAEFDLMWNHAKVFNADQKSVLPADLGSAVEAKPFNDDPDLDVLMTSDNFAVKKTRFSTVRRDSVAKKWVEAIQKAEKHIKIASAVMDSRPVAEALIAKKKANPNLSIQVYMDMKSYISNFSNGTQKQNYKKCLDKVASGRSKPEECNNNYSFGPDLEAANIDVMYKVYAYRFHASYAKQLHNKYMIVDDKILFMGSYNLSDNAEHETFENVVVFRTPGYSSLIQQYKANFTSIWSTGRGNLETLKTQIQDKSQPVIQLLFEPMALNSSELASLRKVFKDECPDVDSEDFRKKPEEHRVCNRQP
jgi:phosphatidylserine/phosphatidylglycerophosphate/cardiolipin synthase-like enzyme